MRPFPVAWSNSNSLLFGVFFKATPEIEWLFSKMLSIISRNGILPFRPVMVPNLLKLL